MIDEKRIKALEEKVLRLQEKIDELERVIKEVSGSAANHEHLEIMKFG